MARHSAPQNLTARRTVLAVATAGVALGAGAHTAAAASELTAPMVQVRRIEAGRIDPQAALRALDMGVRYVLGSVGRVKPNPIADTPVDVLNNGVGTRIADLQPVNSQSLTRPVAQASTIGDIPVLSELPGMKQG
ncbi:hypothetical protein GCM10010145_05420 [Streptomyces ruber]|uniref:TonB-dependent receptor n=2 Tax=Streptomyces TaxID=1883 RepID=A0A918B993_9ACTN|nr:hypothetical protein [Streptomyces ruber]GGQ40388.1 hypothetical protein GCM10010145_05420 [Streptomyces ruber]